MPVYSIVYSVISSNPSPMTAIGYIVGKNQICIFNEINNPRKYRKGTDIKAGDINTSFNIAPVIQDTVPVGLSEIVLEPTGNFPDSQTYFNAVGVAGGTLEYYQKLAIECAQQELELSGVWAKLKYFLLIAGGFSSAFIAWKYTAGSGQNATNNNFVSGDYSETHGLKGNGTTKKISTGFNFTTEGIDKRNFTTGFYSRDSYAKGVALGQDFAGNFFMASGASSLGGGKTSRVDNGGTIPHHMFDGCVTMTGNASNVTTYLGDEIYSQDVPATAGNINGNLDLFGYAGSASYDGHICSLYAGEYLTQDEISTLTTVLNRLNRCLNRREAKRAVFFGDSITWGVGDGGQSARWTIPVASAIGCTEINVAIGGSVFQNTALTAYKDNGFNRFKACVLTQDPEWLFIMYGTNDLRYNGVEFTPALYKSQLLEVIQLAIDKGISKSKIVICTPPYMNTTVYASNAPFNGGSVIRHEEYVTSAIEAATEKGVVSVDTYTETKNNGGNANVGFDKVHLSVIGNTRVADKIISSISI